MERNAKLVNRKFLHYLIPSILMIFAMQFSSLLDGILIGNLISGEALAATSLVMPVLYIIQAPGFALGVGGSIVVANKLGKRDVEGAKKTFSISLIIGIGISLIFAAISFFVSSPLATLFGEASYELSYPYIYMYTSGAMQSIDSSIEECAENLGSNQLRRLLTITIPVVAPSITAGALMVFMSAISIICPLDIKATLSQVSSISLNI